MTATLNERIQKFYDNSTDLWLHAWGEHMHHGYYEVGAKERPDRIDAQVRLIEEVLDWAGVTRVSRIFDAGCGVGGSSRYLVKRFGGSSLGVTLSPVQKRAGDKYNSSAGLTGSINIEVADMLEIELQPGTFDLVWSMESAEHIADKESLFQRFNTILMPDGKLVMATWCCRADKSDLSASELSILDNIYRRYHLPPMVTIDRLAELAESAGFEKVRTDDWSANVAPFWGEVIRTAFHPGNFGRLLTSGREAISGAWAMRYMRKGFARGLLKFAVLSGTKGTE